MNIVRERLANSLLTAPREGSARDVVRQLGAVQAQDFTGAKWALGQRLVGATDAQIESEFARGRILRTHILRPTWHFVAPEDIRWMLALTAPRVAATMASYNRKLELTPALFRRCNRAISQALADGAQLTRPEIKLALEKSRITVGSSQRLSHIVMQAELEAVVCSGARVGKHFTYALFDDRVPARALPDRDDSLQKLLLVYLRGRGPATLRDFSWWSGLTMADSRRAARIAEKSIERTVVGEQELWHLPLQSAPSEKNSVFIVPNYDEYFIGHRDRAAIGERIGNVQLVTGGDARITHIVLVDGQIAGGWKRSQDEGGTVLDFRLLVPLSAAERKRLSGAVASFERFLGVPVRARLATVRGK